MKGGGETYLNTGVQEVDTLWYLKVAAGSFVKRLQIRIALEFTI
jgi:hypothetical protein